LCSVAGKKKKGKKGKRTQDRIYHRHKKGDRRRKKKGSPRRGHIMIEIGEKEAAETRKKGKR